MDPLSAATAWTVTKTTAAIDFASDKAKKGAKDFWEEHFADAKNEVRYHLTDDVTAL